MGHSQWKLPLGQHIHGQAHILLPVHDKLNLVLNL